MATSMDRRTFLTHSAALVGGAGLAATVGSALTAAPARAATTLDYTSRETFDFFDATFHDGERIGQPHHTNEAGQLAWSQSYVLAAFVKMYLAHRDTYYLDRLIHNTDIMLTNRDSERGVHDYRGESLPAWRAMSRYTVGVAALLDGDGRPALEVRSARAYSDTASVTVEHGDGDSFTLTVHNAQYDFTDTYAELSMEPGSSRDAVAQLYDGYPSSRTMATARRLESTGRPAAGTYPLVPQPVIFSVHTGMITYPLASFARIVLRTPALRRNPTYRAKAEEYLDAVRAAVAVHDPEWRESEHGEGYYQWLKGMPVPYDGTAVPINQTTALGRTLVELAAATGEGLYVERATKVARMFRRQLIRDSAQTSIWPYWPDFSQVWSGYEQTGSPDTDVSIYSPHYGGNQAIEDCSHGAISADFAALAKGHDVVFRTPDVRRIARTFTRNLATVGADGIATVHTRMDGTGEAPAGQYLQAPRWMAVCPWNEGVFTHSRDIYDQRAPEPELGSSVLAVASLNWGAHRGGRP